MSNEWDVLKDRKLTIVSAYMCAQGGVSRQPLGTRRNRGGEKSKRNRKHHGPKQQVRTESDVCKHHFYSRLLILTKFRARIKATITKSGAFSSDTSHRIGRILRPGHPVIILPIPISNRPLRHVQSVLRLVQRQSIEGEEGFLLSTWQFVLAASVNLNAAL